MDKKRKCMKEEEINERDGRRNKKRKIKESLNDSREIRRGEIKKKYISKRKERVRKSDEKQGR